MNWGKAVCMCVHTCCWSKHARAHTHTHTRALAHTHTTPPTPLPPPNPPCSLTITRMLKEEALRSQVFAKTLSASSLPSTSEGCGAAAASVLVRVSIKQKEAHRHTHIHNTLYRTWHANFETVSNEDDDRALNCTQ
jgi:hypothetical protein